MKEKTFDTELGGIHYWTNRYEEGRPSLVMLPGLTATHILFDKQVEYFKDKANVLVWDAPAHGASRPFRLQFSMDDMARYLHEILASEGVANPILVGQSMGGYVAQAYMDLFPGYLAGFVSIDSCSLTRRYVTAFDIWALKRVGAIYRLYPWNALKKAGANGCAETDYGRNLMREMVGSYSHDEYVALASFGYRILADALDTDRKYDIDSPTILICGEKDKAGSAKRYNTQWAKGENLPVRWIKGAGHNSNTDKPEEVNRIIEEFVSGIYTATNPKKDDKLD